jgi:GT2 family glycosyltransferase
VRSLVRLHGCPLGVVDLDLPASGLTAEEHASAIEAQLPWAVRGRLADDNLASPAPMPDARGASNGGAAGGSGPRSPAERRALRARAPSASVVVATRDRLQSLPRCLDSLGALDYPDFEVVVVDNAPATNATERLISARYTNVVRYVREARPGLANAHNRGIAAAAGDIVAFVDDDVIVDSGWLLELAMAFEWATDVGCVTGMILAAELETAAQVWSDGRWRLDKGFDPLVFRISDRRRLGSMFPYAAGRFGSGANMAFRRKVLHELGGFDPALGTGTPSRSGDDLAAFFAVLAAGHTLAYTPRAIVRHWHRKDYPSLRRQAYGYGAGVTAYLTKTVVDDPRRLLDLVARTPAGLAHLLNPRSAKNAATPPDYPMELRWRELLGMLGGPVGYLTARRRALSQKGSV